MLQNFDIPMENPRVYAFTMMGVLKGKCAHTHNGREAMGWLGLKD